MWGRKALDNSGSWSCPCVSEPNSEASVGLRNPPEMEHAVPPESEDATHGRPSLSVPEPAAALRQTMILGSSWGTWGVDSPPLRLMVQR